MRPCKYIGTTEGGKQVQLTIGEKQVAIAEQRCKSLYIEPYYDEQSQQYAGYEKTIEWAGNKIDFSLIGSGYSFYNTSTKQTVENLLKNYDGVNSLSLLPYEKNGESYLFVLVNLRATSRRSLLVVYKHRMK